MNINKWSELEEVIKKSVKIALSKVAEKVAYKLYENTKKGIYDHSESKYYKRTKQYLESITINSIKESGNNIEISIFHDPTKIFSRNVEEKGMFNEHMSLDGSDTYGGKSISEWLIDWLELGQNSIVNPEPGHFIVKTTYDQLIKSDFVRKEMVRQLRTLGFTVK